MQTTRELLSGRRRKSTIKEIGWPRKSFQRKERLQSICIYHRIPKPGKGDNDEGITV
ncbi:MAG: hypothetical protein L0H53_13760 [Candidatus Nitrosocosmicus sp.]|nr:hypothetical protein [Candidatus Nitrosocosmicus sp.]